MEVEDALYLLQKEHYEIKSDLDSLYSKKNCYEAIFNQLNYNQDSIILERLLIKDIQHLITCFISKICLLEIKLRDVELKLKRT